MAYYIIVCAFHLLLLSISFAQSYEDANDYYFTNHRIQTRAGRHYCGPNLIKALQLVCESTYHAGKRSVRSLRINEDADSSDLMGVDEIPERPARLATATPNLFADDHFGSRYFHRSLRGVVDDCCKRPCTYHTLRMYCAARK